MPALNCGVVVGSLALGVAQVGAFRHKATAENGVVQVVEDIGSLLQQQSLGTEQVLAQISQYAEEAVSPGAEDKYAASLKDVVSKIEFQIESKIVQAQTATRGKLDTLFKALSAANAAADAAKESADAADKTWFACAADEQAKKQAAEAAEKSLSSSRSNENEVCQLQQDNKGFAFDGAGKYTKKFECDFSQGDCDAKLQAFSDGAIKKMEQDAAAAMAKDTTNYNSLKATCDTKKQERVKAQSAVGLSRDRMEYQAGFVQEVGCSARVSPLCIWQQRPGQVHRQSANTPTSLRPPRSRRGAATPRLDRTSRSGWRRRDPSAWSPSPSARVCMLPSLLPMRTTAPLR